MLVNKSLAALYNGVSQQPATLRLPSQAEAQVNGYSTVVDGLRKRPPTEHLALLTAADISGAYLHTIDRDSDNRFVVTLKGDGTVLVHDLTGAQKTVTYNERTAWSPGRSTVIGEVIYPTTLNGYGYRATTNGQTHATVEPTWPTTPGDTVVDGTVTFEVMQDYLWSANPAEDFVCVTVADYTFILNRSVWVQLARATTDTVAQPASRYRLERAVEAGDVLDDYGRYMIQQAYPYYNPSGGTYRGEKQSFAELPDTPLNGDIWKIKGTSDSNFASYYVRRVGGVWEETLDPNGTGNLIDAVTMPWALVAKPDGTFDVGPFAWAPRRVGDVNTNPSPSFIGRQIKDIFFYKNRLGLAVDEGVALSRAGDFGNFYRLTVLDLLDDEVVDIAASETKVTQINYAVPFADSMMLFSDNVQFRLSHGDGPLTPSSASLDVTTQFRMSPGVRPVGVGSDVYFPTDDGSWTALREYYVRDNSNSADAGNVAAHVPKYIPSGVTKVAASDTHDVLFMLTSAHPNRVYVYKWYWTSENEKAQSAWDYWEFAADANVLSVELLDNFVYLVVKRADGAYLERMSLESGAVAPGLAFNVMLDRRTALTGSFLSGQGVTEFVLPYPVAAGQQPSFYIVKGAAYAEPGAVVSLTPGDYTWVDPTHVRVAGDVSGACIGGLNYTMTYQFSEQFIKNREGVPVTTGKLMLRTWYLYYVDAAYFKVTVAPYGSDPDTEEFVPSVIAEFDGKVVGAATLTLDTPTFETGSFPFSVWGDATIATVTIVNDVPYQATFQQAEWEGFYTNRSRTL